MRSRLGRSSKTYSFLRSHETILSIEKKLSDKAALQQHLERAASVSQVKSRAKHGLIEKVHRNFVISSRKYEQFQCNAISVKPSWFPTFTLPSVMFIFECYIRIISFTIMMVESILKSITAGILRM